MWKVYAKADVEVKISYVSIVDNLINELGNQFFFHESMSMFLAWFIPSIG